MGSALAVKSGDGTAGRTAPREPNLAGLNVGLIDVIGTVFVYPASRILTFDVACVGRPSRR